MPRRKEHRGLDRDHDAARLRVDIPAVLVAVLVEERIVEAGSTNWLGDVSEARLVDILSGMTPRE